MKHAHISLSIQVEAGESKVSDKQRCVGQEEASGMENSTFKMSPYRAIYIFEHALIILAVSADV